MDEISNYNDDSNHLIQIHSADNSLKFEEEKSFDAPSDSTSKAFRINKADKTGATGTMNNTLRGYLDNTGKEVIQSNNQDESMFIEWGQIDFHRESQKNCLHDTSEFGALNDLSIDIGLNSYED